MSKKIVKYNISPSVRKSFPGVTKIKVAKHNVRVVVTQKDSDNGAKKNADSCAMALAACRQFKADGR